MPTLTFPSPAFPALSAVAMTAPGQWVPFDQGDTALALVRAGEPGQFRANVVVSVRRFPSSYSLADAITAVEATLALLPGLTDRGGGPMEVGGHPGYAREVGFTDPDVGWLAHSVRLALVPLPEAGAVDVIDVRATVSLDREPDHLEVIGLLDTLVLTRADERA